MLQQEKYPLELPYDRELRGEILCIEAIVKQWMKINSCKKLASLLELSRIGADDRWFYKQRDISVIEEELRQQRILDEQ